jgi:hypothetical protein
LFQCGYTVARRNSLPEHFIFYISLDWVHLAMGNHVSWEFSMHSGNKFQFSYEHCLCHKKIYCPCENNSLCFFSADNWRVCMAYYACYWLWSHHKSMLSPWLNDASGFFLSWSFSITDGQFTHSSVPTYSAMKPTHAYILQMWSLPLYYSFRFFSLLWRDTVG